MDEEHEEWLHDREDQAKHHQAQHPHTKHKKKPILNDGKPRSDDESGTNDHIWQGIW